MSFLLEPYQFFKRGVHRAVEIHADRIPDVRHALEMARTYGQAGPLVDLFDSYDLEKMATKEDFFVAEDGYPAISHVSHRLVDILRLDEAEEIGLDILGAIVDTELVVGEPIVDPDAPVSPEWLESGPELPHRTAPARRLLEEIDFEAGVDSRAISDVTDMYDRGSLPMESPGDFLLVDVFQEWKSELARRLEAFQEELEEIAAREGVVLSWYDEKTIS